MMTLKKYLALLSIPLFMVSCGGGTTGTGGIDVRGSVVDASGKGLFGVNLTVTSDSGQVIGKAQTDQDGLFTLLNIEQASSQLVVAGSSISPTRLHLGLGRASEGAQLEIQQTSAGTISSRLKVDSPSVQTTGITVAGKLPTSALVMSQSEIPRGPSIGDPFDPEFLIDTITARGAVGFPVSVKDEFGTEHSLWVHISRTGTLRYLARVYVAAKDIVAGVPVDPNSPYSYPMFEVSSAAILDYDENGDLLGRTSIIEPDLVVNIPFWENGAGPSRIEFRLDFSHLSYWAEILDVQEEA